MCGTTVTSGLLGDSLIAQKESQRRDMACDRIYGSLPIFKRALRCLDRLVLQRDQKMYTPSLVRSEVLGSPDRGRTSALAPVRARR